MKINRWIRIFNTLLILVLTGVNVGAYYEQYITNTEPCPLCILQRFAMMGICMGVVMNLYFGVQIKHYAVSLLSLMLGGAVSLRHISLHACSDVLNSQPSVWGLHLYTWAFMVFCASFLVIIALLFIHVPWVSHPISLNWVEQFSLISFFLIVLANFITTFGECGMGVCVD